jgi:murein DD-endopeptidase MepM/ murein hydrolase activator NlpD
MINYSVGRGCVNNAADIKIVQELLIQNGYGAPKTEGLITVLTKAPKAVLAGVGASAGNAAAAAVKITPVTVTGECDAATQSAIDDFQADFMEKPNGRVDPYGTTIQQLWPVKWANPTRGGVRPYYGEAGYDGMGYVSFASHHGEDYMSTPGQAVYAAMSGRVVSLANPYSDWPALHGILIIASDGTACYLFYMNALQGTVGSIVRAGDSVGIAQSLQEKYPGIIEHIHVQIIRSGTFLDLVNLIKT